MAPFLHFPVSPMNLKGKTGGAAASAAAAAAAAAAACLSPVILQQLPSSFLLTIRVGWLLFMD